MTDLPLNDDGSIDYEHIIPEMWALLIGIDAVPGMACAQNVEIADLCKAVEAHTIERCAKVADKQQVAFGSNEYSIGQPASSFKERFACGRVAEEIRALGETK